MDSTGWIAVAGNAVLVVTLFVFVYQARAMRQQVRLMADQSRDGTLATRAHVYQGLAQLMIDVDRIFIEYPALRPYFYDNVEEPDDPIERNRVSAIAETHIDMMDNLLTQSPHLEDIVAEPWDDYFRDLMRRSPAIRRFWAEHREWYGDDMCALLDPVAKEFVGK